MERNKQIQLADFEPPITYEMECEVLGALVNDQTLIPTIESFLREDMFFNDKTRELYKTIMDMYRNHETVGLVTLYPKVDRAFFNQDILGKGEFATELSIVDDVAALNLMCQKRKLYFACIKGLQMSVSHGSTIEEMVSLPERLAEEMKEGIGRHTIKPLSEVLNEVGDNLQKGTERHIPTGFPSLDKLFDGGWGKGHLVILAARPSVGKTAFMLQMVRAAARSNFKALALSLEMTNEELGKRMLYSTEIITPLDISYGNVNWSSFEAAVTNLDSENIYLDETPQSLEEVMSTITIAHQQGKCDVAFVDYLQLMTSNDNTDSIYRQVTNMTKRLKKLAKALKIPIVVLCQLNRKCVDEKRSPQVQDLRDSGSIEQDANKIIMLERPTDAEGDLGEIVYMWIRKNREGLGGSICIKVQANSTYTRFTEVRDEKQ